jgi:hypothetical protein
MPVSELNSPAETEHQVPETIQVSGEATSLDLDIQSDSQTTGSWEIEEKIVGSSIRASQGILSSKLAQAESDAHKKLTPAVETGETRKMPPPGVLSSNSAKAGLGTKVTQAGSGEKANLAAKDVSGAKESGKSTDKSNPQPIGRLSTRKKFPEAG